MKQYLDLLNDVLLNGKQTDDRTGTGTRSVFGRQIRFDLREGFPIVTTKNVPFRWVKEELWWFLSGSTQESDLSDKGVDIWKEWATPEQCARFGRQPGDLGPVYGKLWRDYDGVDQVSDLLREIEHNPNSRRLIVTGWHPRWQKEVALPPCHTLWQCKVYGDEMSLSLYARSIDIFLGLPFNVSSYALLLHWLCKEADLKPAELIISFGDLHLYNNHVEQAKLQLTRQPYPLPTLDSEFNLVGYTSHPKIVAEVSV